MNPKRRKGKALSLVIFVAYTPPTHIIKLKMFGCTISCDPFKVFLIETSINQQMSFSFFSFSLFQK